MDWYYAENNERRGPISEEEFNRLIQAGQLTPATQVWRSGFERWMTLSEAGLGMTATAPGETAACVECHRTFPKSDMVQYEGAWICPTCKPVFFQKVKEGIEPARAMNYAGFWIRFLAKFVDGLIQQIFNFLFGLFLGVLFSRTDQQIAFSIISILISLLVSAAYSIFLTGKYGATIGKMALGLRTVRSDGSAVSYGLATGRFFAEILSSFTLLIGYIIAAFDEEKRTLHDRICDTRVIRSRA